MLHRHINQLGHVFYLKFMEDIFSVRIHRERTEKEFIRNDLAGFSLGQKFQNFLFTLGEAGEAVQFVLRRFADDVLHFVAEHNVPRKGTADTATQLFDGGVFQQVATRTVLQALHDDASLRMVAEHNDGSLRRFFLDLCTELNTAGIGQRNVEQHDVGSIGRYVTPESRAIVESAANLEEFLVFEHHFQALDHYGMVIYNDDADVMRHAYSIQY